MSTVSGKLITAEELMAMGDAGPCELVRGEVKRLTPVGFRHARVTAALTELLRSFVRARDLGVVLTGEVGFVLSRNPDTVRAADVAFLRKDRLAEVPEDAYIPFAPDLAVEIVSPGNTWTEVEGKVCDYLAAGTRMVWVIDPAIPAAYVHRPDSLAKRIGPSDELSGEDVLSGFSVRLADL